MSALDSAAFEQRNTFVAERLKTCNYRFYKILQTRRLEVPKIANNYNDS
jgi:hypothetical protein